MPTEADTCRTYLLPKLYAAGWEDEQLVDGLQAQVSALRATQDESARELQALMPSILDRAFKGEL